MPRMTSCLVIISGAELHSKRSSHFGFAARKAAAFIPLWGRQGNDVFQEDEKFAAAVSV